MVLFNDTCVYKWEYLKKVGFKNSVHKYDKGLYKN